MLQAGRWPAVVPDKAVLKGVMGFLANETAAGLRDEITARMAEAFGGDCRASFTFCRDAGVVNADPALLPDLKKAYLRSGLEPATGAMTSYCDAWFYSSRGVPTAIFGAGSLRSAHTADENVPIGEIAAAAEILVRLALVEGETIMTGENV
jgi:acetylornithine deacetylase